MTTPKVHRNALTTFVRKHCANWDKSSKTCIGVDGEILFNEGPCLVAMGKPCAYFEKAVFPICDPLYRYATETAQYETLLGLYVKINPHVIQTEAEKLRLCDCGTPLKPRRRVCDECQKRNKKEARRKWRKTAILKLSDVDS